MLSCDLFCSKFFAKNLNLKFPISLWTKSKITNWPITYFCYFSMIKTEWKLRQLILKVLFAVVDNNGGKNISVFLLFFMVPKQNHDSYNLKSLGSIGWKSFHLLLLPHDALEFCPNKFEYNKLLNSLHTYPLSKFSVGAIQKWHHLFFGRSPTPLSGWRFFVPKKKKKRLWISSSWDILLQFLHFF